MKPHVLSLFVVTALFANVVNAQTIYPPLRADVPFAFQAGKVKLPAGEYEVKSMLPGVLQVSNVETRRAIVMQVHGGTRAPAAADAKFVFQRYGDQYFLRQVWQPGASGLEAPVTQLERELQARAPGDQQTIVARKR